MLRHLLILFAAIFFLNAKNDDCANCYSDINKYVRYSSSQESEAYGLLVDDMVYKLDGDIFNYQHVAEQGVLLSEISILPPVIPKKIIACANNYLEYASVLPQKVEMFTKLPSSIIGDSDYIVIPDDVKDVHSEIELVLVIGKKCYDVSVEDAPNYIFGVTIGNDITARDFQKKDLQWLRSKSIDTFAPIGPFIATGLDYNNLTIKLYKNNQLIQIGNSKDMIYKPADIVSYISRYITLEPGDLIFTGTPAKTSEIHSGDFLSGYINGIGTLKNYVR